MGSRSSKPSKQSQPPKPPHFSPKDNIMSNFYGPSCLEDSRVKISLIGSCRVGKSQLMRTLTGRDFEFPYNKTIGVQFISHIYPAEDRQFRVNYWDLSGDMRFVSITLNYIRSTHLILVFDVTRKQTLLTATNFWLEKYQDRIDNVDKYCKFLIGSKVDSKSKRQVSRKRGEEAAKKLGLVYAEVSARTGEGLQQFLAILFKELGTKPSVEYKELDVLD